MLFLQVLLFVLCWNTCVISQNATIHDWFDISIGHEINNAAIGQYNDLLYIIMQNWHVKVRKIDVINENIAFILTNHNENLRFLAQNHDTYDDKIWFYQNNGSIWNFDMRTEQYKITQIPNNNSPVVKNPCIKIYQKHMFIIGGRGIVILLIYKIYSALIIYNI